jgi:DeoR family transcriptional regulator, aga operon transcriptional repressor
MRQAQRLEAILEGLSADGSVAVTMLTERFGVSAATIRRDLDVLERQHLLMRTHGGAVPQRVLYELPLRYKASRHEAEKRLIAETAARRVDDGAAVGLTGGTTTTQVARALADRPRLTVVTNALNIASELAIRPNIKLVVTGGYARAESYELVGPLAVQSLSRLRLDVVFVGADGISASDGLTTHHEVEADTNRALIQRAKRVIVVADGSKLGRAAFAQICPIEMAHELITDPRADAAEIAQLQDVGLAVTVA